MEASREEMFSVKLFVVVHSELLSGFSTLGVWQRLKECVGIIRLELIKSKFVRRLCVVCRILKCGY